jgi:hypothetical protein
MHYLGRVDGVAALALSTTGLSSCYAPPPQLETPPTGPSPLAMAARLLELGWNAIFLDRGILYRAADIDR